MAWMTGNGSSVGPGIMSMGRVCTWVQLIVDDTVGSPWRPAPGHSTSSRFHDRPRRRRAVDEPQIARVDDQASALAEDEDRVAAVDRVGEHGDAASDGEIPERARHDAAPATLGRDPLHEEPGREKGLPEQTDAQPDSLRRHPLRKLG